MRIIYIILLVIVATITKSQNIVLNGSVENFQMCQTQASDSSLSNVNSWYSPSLNSPDYFNSCAGPLSSGGNFSMPNNIIGYQYPRTCNTYSGFYAYHGTDSIGGREYIGISLKTTLIANKTYHIRFFYSNAGEIIPTQTYPYNYYYCSVDSLAIAFTDSAIKYNTINIIPLNPQVYDTSGYNMDTVTWKEFIGEYTANGSESFIIIGYFNYRGVNNIQSSIPILPNTFMDAYYYLDDIAIWPADTIPPPANAGADTTICRGGNAKLGTHSYNDYIYEWWPATTLSNDSGGVVWASPLHTTTYYLQATDDIYTKTLDSVTVYVNQCGQNDTTVCVEQKFVLGNTSNPLWNYQWDPATYLSSDTIGMPFCNPMNGISYQLLILNTNGDTIALDSTHILVGACHYAQAGRDSLICKGDSLQIGAFGPSYVTYQWSPNFMISDTTVSNPVVWPDTITKYYLTVIDSIGNISYDSVLIDVQICPSIEEINNTDWIKVFPNPADDKLYIENRKLTKKNIEIIIFNILGQEIINQRLDGGTRYNLDISKLDSGVYFYTIISNDDVLKIDKFIKL